MTLNLPKDKTDKFLEIRDPAESIGLWSHHANFSSTLHPIAPTHLTLGRFFNDDLVRHETYAEALKMMRAKGWNKTPAQKLREYAAQYLGERVDETGKGEWPPVPRWYGAWHRFAMWLEYCKTAKPPTDVRLSFGSPLTGDFCAGKRHRSSRVVFLKNNERNFVGVMMKDGWYGWDLIEKPSYKDNPYERLVLSMRRGATWQTVDADVITELVQGKRFCLFEMERHPFFDALTDPKNKAETLGGLARNVEFYVHDPNGPEERFYMIWSATFNPLKSKYAPCNKNEIRLVETMSERGKSWIGRRIEVNDPAKAEDAARWVAENNGCALLPPNPPDELRLAVMRALFYITFPDRAIDAPGGLLRGYQLPGRMVQYATKPIRHDGGDAFLERQRIRAQATVKRKRGIVVDTLLDRAARVVAARNGLEKDEALRRICEVGGRAIIETAAWRWGFMDGNALTMFVASPNAGSLKLPDLSLAIGFEHRLALDGGRATVGKLVQTARIVPLADSLDATRFCRDCAVAATRLSTPRHGTEKDVLTYATESLRIIRDGRRYLLLVIPRYAQYKYGRDLLFDPQSGSVAVQAYRCISEEKTRARKGTRIEEEPLDFNKIMNLAKDGRVHLYSLDPGPARWLFDAAYTTANRRPCRIVPSIPRLLTPGSGKLPSRADRGNGSYIVTDVPSDAEAVEVRLTFTFNPAVPRDGRKYEGRSWKSYCDAYPSEAARETVPWPTAEATAESLKDAARRVVETDGVLLTDAEHLSAAAEAMRYVVTQTSNPYAPGGTYRGYMIADRVFKAPAARPSPTARPRQELSGRPLVEILSPTLAASAERAFAERIEADRLSDKKTAKFFSLEAPIVIGDDYKAMVAREFRRIAYTGTMGWRQQIVRPAHEVALGIWLARLVPVNHSVG